MQLPRMFNAVAIVFTAACGLTFAAPQVRQAPMLSAEQPLTLSDCIGLAMKNQPSVRQAAAVVEAQRGFVSQARSRLLPDTSAAGSGQVAGSSGESRSSFNLAGSQLLYDFGRSRYGMTQAERELAAGAQGYRATSADVILSVKLAYYELLRTTNLVRVFAENLKTSEEHVLLAQEKLNAGLAPKADLLKAQAAEASARVDLVAARNSADQARVDLNDAMGVDVRSLIEIGEAAEPDCPVPEEDQVVDLATTNRPEVRQASESVAASQAAVKASQTGNLPALTTSLGGSHVFTGDSFGSGTSWQWLMNLQWTPFDSGYTRGAVIQARAQLVSAEESLYATKQIVSRDAVAARLNILAADEALAAATVEVTSAKEDMDAATGRYKAGVGILLEVLDAQAGLLKAQVDELASRYGLSKARANLERAIGATMIEGIAK